MWITSICYSQMILTVAIRSNYYKYSQLQKLRLKSIDSSLLKTKDDMLFELISICVFLGKQKSIKYFEFQK